MEQLVRMRQKGATVRFLDRFGGFCATETPVAGQFAWEENLSAHRYPALSTRLPRREIPVTDAGGGLLAKEHLWYVSGSKLRHDDVAVELGLTAGEKQMVSMGAYLLVWPDKKYVNTADITDCGSMEQVNTVTSAVVTLCDQSGSDIICTRSATAPASPTGGERWLDTSVTPPELKAWRSDSAAWEVESPTYVKLASAGIGAGLQRGDGLEVSGFSDESLNGVFPAEAAENDFVVIPGMVAATLNCSGQLTVARTVPDMDFVTECDNRIWGCRYGTVEGRQVNEIYACKLGDFRNWRCYQGLSTDSYAATRGSDGPWTGAVTYGAQPLFFKANALEKVYPSATGAHRIVSLGCRGVAAGCHRSLQIVDETLYYLSPQGVCAYTGSLPRAVSADLGRVSYDSAAAGGWDGCYYISMRRSDNHTWHLFTYDAQRRIWHRQDDTHAAVFALWGGQLYCLTAEGKLFAMDGGDGQAPMDWVAESGPLHARTPGSQYVRRFVVRCETQGRFRLQIRYDDGPWEKGGTYEGHGQSSFVLPVQPRRCSAVYLRLSGNRPCRLDAIAAYWEGGSDQLW